MDKIEYPNSEFRLHFISDIENKIPMSKWVYNAATTLSWTNIGAYWIPTTRNEFELDYSYVISPYAALILYSRQEMSKLPKILQSLSIILWPLAGLLKLTRINQNVCINNWLLSTNLYPENHEDKMIELAERAKITDKDSFIIFRSLNKRTNGKLMEKLKSAGFTFIPSRQVYFFDFNNFIEKKYQNFIWDQKLLSKKKYEIVPHEQITSEDLQRSVELYNFLYLDKYSSYNPAFSEEYLQLCYRTGVLHFIGLRDTQGCLQGIVGFYFIDKTVTVPIVGYNTSLPLKEGLYRMLMALTFNYSKKNNYTLNLSSGASGFKRLRGGQPEIEYSAVYIKHLPLYRQIGFRVTQFLLFTIALPLLKIFKL